MQCKGKKEYNPTNENNPEYNVTISDADSNLIIGWENLIIFVKILRAVHGNNTPDVSPWKDRQHFDTVGVPIFLQLLALPQCRHRSLLKTQQLRQYSYSHLEIQHSMKSLNWKRWRILYIWLESRGVVPGGHRVPYLLVLMFFCFMDLVSWRHLTIAGFIIISVSDTIDTLFLLFIYLWLLCYFLTL